MIEDPLLIREVESCKEFTKGKGPIFGRYIGDPSLPLDYPSFPMSIIYPSLVPIEISVAPVNLGGDATGSWEDAVSDLVQSRGLYYLKTLNGPLPPVPFVIAGSRFVKAGVLKIKIRLHARTIADLPEFESMCEVNEWAARKLQDQQLLPGINLPPAKAPSTSFAKAKLLTSGMYLVVERETMCIDKIPVVLRLGEFIEEDVVETTLFWTYEMPDFRSGDRLWRRLLPMPRLNGRFREKLIASVI